MQGKSQKVFHSNIKLIKNSFIFQQKREHQEVLSNHGLVPALNMLLCSPHADVQLPALQCLANLVFNNENIARMVVNSSYNHRSMLQQIVILMDRNRKIEMQLAAARCVTYLYRCKVLDEDNENIILYKALPCVVITNKIKIEFDCILNSEILYSLGPND